MSQAIAVPDAARAEAAFDVLWDPPSGIRDVRGVRMPADLHERYGGRLEVPLRPDRPTFIANFVSTIDGVVALGSGALSGGGVISGFHEPDRFTMALLRAIADVVVIGAGTLRGSTAHRWTPEHVQPDRGPALRTWRAAMGLAPQPTTVVVTASGDLPVTHPGLSDPTIPVVIATTPSGARRLGDAGLRPHVIVEAIGGGPRVSGMDLLGLVACLGARVALSEGGPHLLAELIAHDLLDELFLTVAPQLVGRDGRMGLLEGIALTPSDARWHELVSVRRSEHHLFLRYRHITPSPSHGRS